jgi:GTP-binding protein EngB required for normal cell division
MGIYKHEFFKYTNPNFKNLGYGFSYMNEDTKKSCDDLTISYLRDRGSSLKRVLLLVDARHGFKLGDKVFFK